jgi:hypothetical protein
MSLGHAFEGDYRISAFSFFCIFVPWPSGEHTGSHHDEVASIKILKAMSLPDHRLESSKQWAKINLSSEVDDLRFLS